MRSAFAWLECKLGYGATVSANQRWIAMKPRIPPADSIIHCETCGKPTNGKGWYGPECMCDQPKEPAWKGAHSIGTRAPR